MSLHRRGRGSQHSSINSMTCAIETRQLPRQQGGCKLVHVLTTFVMSRRTTLLTTLRTTFLRLPSLRRLYVLIALRLRSGPFPRAVAPGRRLSRKCGHVDGQSSPSGCQAAPGRSPPSRRSVLLVLSSLRNRRIARSVSGQQLEQPRGGHGAVSGVEDARAVLVHQDETSRVQLSRLRRRSWRRPSRKNATHGLPSSSSPDRVQQRVVLARCCLK